jgi:hypothetical protein
MMSPMYINMAMMVAERNKEKIKTKIQETIFLKN